MKFKIILLSAGLITSILSGLGFNYYNQTNSAKEIANTTENVVIAEVDEIQKNETEEKNEVENKVVEEVKEIAETKQEEQVVEEKIDLKPQEKSEDKPVSKPQEAIQKSPEVKQEPTKPSTPPVQEKPKVEEKKKTEPTQSDLEYWCVSGGNHHVAGDGANEHGYYSSWDQANSAFESYTNGWASVQYKISQCPCGLYYFWAIK